MFYKSLLLVLLLITFEVSGSQDDSFDRVVEELVYEKIADPRIIIDLQYDSKDRVAKVIKTYNQVQSVLLTSLDPTYSSFKLQINYHQGQVVEIFGRYSSFIEVPVISRAIKSGEIISASDISLTKTRLNRLKNSDYVTSESEIIGMQAKKALLSGTLVRKNELRNPPVIKTNDLVNVIYQASNIKIKTTAVALGPGAVGDLIKVKNQDTGTVLLGQIINKNTVQVGNNNE